MLLSPDLVPHHILGLLVAEDAVAASAACSQWLAGWKATNEPRRWLKEVPFENGASAAACSVRSQPAPPTRRRRGFERGRWPRSVEHAAPLAIPPGDPSSTTSGSAVPPLTETDGDLERRAESAASPRQALAGCCHGERPGMSETEACTATGASLSNKKWRRRVQHAQLLPGTMTPHGPVVSNEFIFPCGRSVIKTK